MAFYYLFFQKACGLEEGHRRSEDTRESIEEWRVLWKKTTIL